MIAWKRPPIGLLGRIFAILLAAIIIEFGASTFLYERTSRLSLREDEAHRVAEHLAVASRLIAERPYHDRETLAKLLSGERFEVGWSATLLPRPPIAPELREMTRQIVQWQPELARSDIRLHLASPGRNGRVMGELRLPDGTWLNFTSNELVKSGTLAANRVLIAVTPAVALIIIAGLLLSHTLRPLRLLARAAERIGHGTEIILPEHGSLDVRRLIRAFNEMQERIHRLIADRTEALAAVGHDLRTPLARLQLRLDTVDDRALRAAFGEDLDQMNAMLESLLAFLGGESDPEAPVRTDVAVLVSTLVDRVADAGAHARFTGPDHLEAEVRPTRLRRALGNVIDNAITYGGRAEVSIRADAEALVIRVEDEGPGIPEERQQSVLEPFIRLDSARQRNTKGLGLGLAIVSQVMQREGGAVAISNRPGRGLRVDLILPPVPPVTT